jgi:hypothetical protein
MEIEISNELQGNIAFDLYLRSREDPNRIGIIYEDGEHLTFVVIMVEKSKVK